MEKFDVVGRPAYGQKALVLVPKTANQAIWAKLIKPGASMVGFKAQGFDATIITRETSTGPRISSLMRIVQSAPMGGFPTRTRLSPCVPIRSTLLK